MSDVTWHKILDLFSYKPKMHTTNTLHENHIFLYWQYQEHNVNKFLK